MVTRPDPTHSPDRADGARNDPGRHVYRPDGAAYDAQRLQAHPVLRGAGHEDICQGQDGASGGPGQGRGRSQGRGPFRCSHCGEEMEIWRIWHPTYGVIYDEGEVIKRGTYAATAPRAGP